jgi:hypothetical protein
VTPRQPRDTQLHCPRCGFTTSRTTPRMASHALRRHSCGRWLGIAERKARGQARHARIDTTARDCHHSIARHQHGTYQAYKLDCCRCGPCRVANAEYARRMHRQKGYGTWTSYVDAEPARQHVRALQAQGMGWKRIAHAAGLHTSVVWKLLYGDPSRNLAPSRRIRPQTAERLLAVQPELADGALIPAGDTWMLVMRLVADGWPLAHIARHVHGPRARALQLGRWQVTVANARAVAELYEQLRDRPGPSLRARRHAEKYAWDSAILPDPDEPPAVQQSRTEALLEDAQWLLDGGLSVELIADRLGITVGYLTDLLDAAKGRAA